MAADIDGPDFSFYRRGVAIADKGTSPLINRLGNLIVGFPRVIILPRSRPLLLERVVEAGFIDYQIVFLRQVLNDLKREAARIVQEKRLDTRDGTGAGGLDSSGPVVKITESLAREYRRKLLPLV